MASVRPLSPEDAEAFLKLRLEALREHPAAFSADEADWRSKSVEEAALLLSGARGSFVLGAFDAEGELVGMAGFQPNDKPKLSHKGILWGMYVTARVRRQGAGRALVEALLNRARLLPGIRRVNLGVIRTDGGAGRLYASAGFQVYGTEPRSLHYDGTFYDEDLMYFEWEDGKTGRRGGCHDIGEEMGLGRPV
ncbi:GNAT family N-acetyltransferase [Paenibacillus mucilaginosus]|uniref:GNAT family N-acetyltransferase n=1 Tax=Paenibacillus mucilaginosus TaxID=61624 RepID=UPI00031C7B3B|nr:GNAT family protein [Paenibacillus mucilaginosus]MCG7217018.1 GNAT family N-acetyltransferase [Paenibacillus mucilaginosus]WDM26116.1 GNAT family N-acetyltransferase [Paenibacillus mucilaginosus]